MIFYALTFTVGVVAGVCWQTHRIRREAQRRATFLRHLNDLQRMSRP